MARPNEDDPQVAQMVQMLSTAKQVLETARRLLSGDFSGKEGEQNLREELGYYKDGHIYIIYEYADETRAPVLAIADSPKEALNNSELFGGVIYRYRKVFADKLNSGYVITVAELKNLVARARPA